MRRRLWAAYAILAAVAVVALFGAVAMARDGGSHCTVGLHDHLIPSNPRSPFLVARENFESGIYPIGRPFVVVDCDPE